MIFFALKHLHRLKVQQDIIELQKLKLERQERLINELKYTRLADATRESQAACQQELRSVRRTGCADSKLIARRLQLVGNLHDPAADAGVADEYERLCARGTPKFLQDMQARALERNVRHQEARDRRERHEREKEEQRLAAEAAKVSRLSCTMCGDPHETLTPTFSSNKTNRPNSSASQSYVKNVAASGCNGNNAKRIACGTSNSCNGPTNSIGVVCCDATDWMRSKRLCVSNEIMCRKLSCSECLPACDGVLAAGVQRWRLFGRKNTDGLPNARGSS